MIEELELSATYLQWGVVEAAVGRSEARRLFPQAEAAIEEQRANVRGRLLLNAEAKQLNAHREEASKRQEEEKKPADQLGEGRTQFFRHGRSGEAPGEEGIGAPFAPCGKD